MVLEKEMPDKDKIFTEMLNQYEKLAFSICYKMTGSYFDAEDLAQETFLSIYKSLDSFDGRFPGGFVTRIDVNKCLDFLKRADRRTVPAEESILLENASSVPPPEEGVLQEETKRELMRACSTLKPPFRLSRPRWAAAPAGMTTVRPQVSRESN